ncbi:hypothetical protein IWQ56_000919 [Coemansia nantahalensis]|nr:hypothetical protein IWQ56_000919 [Coemansia nantahalensis]
MKTTVLSHLAVGASVLVASAAGQQTVRMVDAARVQGMKGGILIKNGAPTTCELALNSDKVAFVAAACLDFQPNSNIVNPSAKYQVMLTGGGTTSMGAVNVNSVVAHPMFNPRTFANNVAILNLEQGSQGEWRNYIGANPSEWQSLFYADREVTSSGSWTAAQAVQASTMPAPQCAANSALYAANAVDFLCTSQTMRRGSCAAPYGSVYGVKDPNLAVAALYSHSVIADGDLCSGTQITNYYTLLSNYLEWAGAVSRVPIYLFADNKKYVNNNDPNYRMREPAADNFSGMLVGGDLNTNRGTLVGPASAPNPAPGNGGFPVIPSPPAPTGGPVSSSMPPAVGDSSASKLSVSTILLIVAGILLLLALLGWLLYRRFKKRPAPTHEMTQYNNNEYAIGGQDYTPEYANEFPSNREHLDNQIRTRDSYHPGNANGNSRGGFMD